MKIQEQVRMPFTVAFPVMVAQMSLSLLGKHMFVSSFHDIYKSINLSGNHSVENC